MTAKNKIGLEAEFFLRDKDNKLVYPAEYGFGYDDLIILGEFRADPGETRANTIANFIKVWYETLELAKSKNLTIDFNTGWTEVTPEFYANLMRKIGTKNIAQCRNIYPDIDLLRLTDAVVENGEIKAQKLSIGLHIHFSSVDIVERIYKRKVEQYSPVKIPLSIGNVNSAAEMNFYQKISEKDEEENLKAVANKITMPVLRSIVKDFDDVILPSYVPGVHLKYRKPGFYELKSYGGFEYRSLPFTKAVLDNIYYIVDFAFSKLEELELE